MWLRSTAKLAKWGEFGVDNVVFVDDLMCAGSHRPHGCRVLVTFRFQTNCTASVVVFRRRTDRKRARRHDTVPNALGSLLRAHSEAWTSRDTDVSHYPHSNSDGSQPRNREDFSQNAGLSWPSTFLLPSPPQKGGCTPYFTVHVDDKEVFDWRRHVAKVRFPCTVSSTSHCQFQC
jgi:hypothetical protein